MSKQEIESDSAPRAIGPYSQAVRSGNFLFLSGQIPIDPATGELIAGNVEAQTKQVLRNIEGLLKAAGLGPQNVVKATVYLKDLSTFGQMNSVYGGFFNPPYPARSTVEVKDLPKGSMVEIDVMAMFNE
ncbi:MAG: RidA family protein [Deltaproteobacteria bacterium]|nr:RidA family protein [Deltaproteobacteria bacterium]